MGTLTRIVTLTLALVGMTAFDRALAQDAADPTTAAEPAKQWVWLSSQGVWGYGYQIEDGPNRGLWKIDPDSKQAPVVTDPYGFAEVLNRYRVAMGLPPVAYDPELSTWAVQNNIAQTNRGLGHHVNPNCFQNCGWNYPDAESVGVGWMNSPGHRQNMLQPGVSRFGIAFGPGPYWTMNAM